MWFHRDNAVFVTLIDGNVHAIDADTGESLWMSSVGSPLISSWNLATEDPEAGTTPPAVFPGVDGSLYSYRSGTDGEVKLEVLLTPPMLLHRNLCCIENCRMGRYIFVRATHLFRRGILYGQQKFVLVELSVPTSQITWLWCEYAEASIQRPRACGVVAFPHVRRYAAILGFWWRTQDSCSAN